MEAKWGQKIDQCESPIGTLHVGDVVRGRYGSVVKIVEITAYPGGGGDPTLSLISCEPVGPGYGHRCMWNNTITGFAQPGDIGSHPCGVGSFHWEDVRASWDGGQCGCESAVQPSLVSF